MFKLFKKRQQSTDASGQLDEVSQTKRWLFKSVATAGVAATAIGGWIGVSSKSKQEIDPQAAYDQDVLPGDKILQGNGFEEISQEETEEMVQMFINDYEHKRQV